MEESEPDPEVSLMQWTSSVEATLPHGVRANLSNVVETVEAKLVERTPATLIRQSPRWFRIDFTVGGNTRDEAQERSVGLVSNALGEAGMAGSTVECIEVIPELQATQDDDPTSSD